MNKTAVRMGAGLLRVGGARYSARMRALFGASLVAYWPLWEPAGTAAADLSGNGRAGSYTGVDLANEATPKGALAPFFDGVNDYVDVYSVSLRDGWNPAEGSYLGWARQASAAVWAEGTSRRALYFAVDSNTYVMVGTDGGQNAWDFRYRAGGVLNQLKPASGATAAWVHLALTWSASGNRVRVYLNGAQQGADLGPVGAWGAGVLNANTTTLGAAGKTPLGPWKGWLADAMILNREASAAEIANAFAWS